MSLIVGIAGGSGSGKSTLARALVQRLEGMGALISHDDYYKHTPGMTEAQRYAYNFDVPEALDTWLLVEHVKCLKAGQAVELPQYDFETQTRKADTRHLEPLPIVIVEGILSMSSPELRELMDLAIYVDAPADIRLLRRFKRDIEERGHSFEGATEMYLKGARPAHQTFVEPMKEQADLIITNVTNPQTLDLLAAGLKALATQGPASR